MAIPSRQIGWGTEENLLYEISRQLEALTGVISKIGQGQTTTTTTTLVPPNCIEFVVNTTYGTYFEFTASSAAQDFTYTITWGDGTTDTGSSGEGAVNLVHNYTDVDTEYTARLCVSDGSVINNLDFFGFD